MGFSIYKIYSDTQLQSSVRSGTKIKIIKIKDYVRIFLTDYLNYCTYIFYDLL